MNCLSLWSAGARQLMPAQQTTTTLVSHNRQLEDSPQEIRPWRADTVGVEDGHTGRLVELAEDACKKQWIRSNDTSRAQGKIRKASSKGEIVRSVA